MSPVTFRLSLVPPPTNFFPSQGRGVVERTITPSQPGRVYFQATFWPARLIHPSLRFLPGTPVEVMGREGLTLLVKPVAHRGSGR